MHSKLPSWYFVFLQCKKLQAMKTILIVEDTDDIRENVAEMLELANYKVLTARNGKEGVELARTHVPDLVISDIMMPLVDGFGMLHMLRRDPRTESIPFIFLTAKSERTEFRNAMESGADDFISKPFNNDELLKAVENRFKRQEVMINKIGNDLAESNNLKLDGNENGESLEQLFIDSETRTYTKKQVIYKEGVTPRFLFCVLKGKVKTSKTHEFGKSLSIDLYTKGDFLGYVALLEDCIYKETAEALEDNTEIAMVPRKTFEEILHKNPPVARKLIQILAKNVGEKEKQLLDIAYNTLRQKVAGTLVSLERKYHTNKNQLYSIDLSRDELASIAGTATETFIRTLTDFRGEKLIDIKKDNSIEILNLKKLESILK